MLEEICKALAEETNIRENLIELKKSIKNQDALKNTMQRIRFCMLF